MTRATLSSFTTASSRCAAARECPPAILTASLQCANQLAETYSLPDQKVVYYLVTDSAHLRQDAIEKLGDKVVVSGAGIEHIHVKSGHADGVFSAVLEDWILAKTDYRVITQDSGFVRLRSLRYGSCVADLSSRARSPPSPAGNALRLSPSFPRTIWTSWASRAKRATSMSIAD